MKRLLRHWWETSHWWLALMGFCLFSAYAGGPSFLAGIGLVFVIHSLYFFSLSFIIFIRALLLR